MARKIATVVGAHKSLTVVVSVLVFGVMAAAAGEAWALGEGTRVEIRTVTFEGGPPPPHASATRRLSWEVRKRTSVETRLTPESVRLDSPAVFESPFLYLSGEQAFEPLSQEEVAGLRRFVEFGGFVLIDDASPDGAGFDASVRRLLSRAFPRQPLRPLPETHTLYRAFYLVERPVGRVEGPDHLLGIEAGERTAVVYSRHDLGGAWARDNLGTWQHAVVPGGERQREVAIRLGVNLLMYALCLDYKDDQVHAPFILRRLGGSP